MSTTKFVKVYAYELFTPKFDNVYYDPERYDHEQTEYLFKCILKLGEDKRAFRYKNKMINLVSFKDSDDSEIIEGKFTSARYGKEQDIINVFSQMKTASKGEKEGVKNEVIFLLDKRNGLLLVEQDSERAVTRDMIQRYLKYHVRLMDSYMKAFEKINKPLIIPPNAFIKVNTIPSKEFFNEIRELHTIKEAYVLAKTNKSVNNEAVKYLRKEAEDNEVDGFQQMKLVFQNKVKKSGIKHVEAYFRKMMETEKYDGYGVVGYSRTGKRKNIDISSKIGQAYDLNVQVNNNNVIDYSELISLMVDIAKKDNPILNKNQDVEPLKKVLGEFSDELKKEEITSKNE